MKQWIGTDPQTCDMCHSAIKKMFVDGKTQFGMWAMMCPSCHAVYGVGLGTGLGQAYQRIKSKWIQLKTGKR